MSKYVNKSIEELAAQLKAGLLRLRKGYVDAAEELFHLVDAGADYPYEFVVFRITGYRHGRSDHSGSVMAGRGLARDLLQLILDVCSSFGLRTEEYEPTVYDTEMLAAKFNISEKTVQRWRSRGLVARKLLFPDGQKRIAFLESSLRIFVQRNRRRIMRSIRFSQLLPGEKEDIIRRARRMAAFTHCSLSEVARKLSRRTGRAIETIRYTIRRHDTQHPDHAVFPYLTGPLRDQEKEAIYRNFLFGISVPLLAKRYCRTRGSIYRIIGEVRAQQLQARPIEYVYNAQFDLPNADAVILREEDEADLPKPSVTTKPPPEVPPYLRSLYDAPLLTAQQEQSLFRRFNYLKCKADNLRKQIKGNRVRTSSLKRIEALLLQANAVKNKIIRSNLRLVVSIAKKHLGGPQSLFELISDGNVALMKAVERFDYSRGNRFSTYASWAIMRNFARSVPRERYQLDHFATGNEEILDIAAGLRSYDPDEINVPELRESLDAVLTQLSPRERAILIEHYGLDATREPKTLDQLSQGLGISKERVRQIEIHALKKLRRILNPEKTGIMV